MSGVLPATPERLRRNILFEDLDDATFEQIRPKFVARRFRSGEIIVRDESDGDELFLLADGRVKIIKRTRSGEENMLALLHPGDFFGELELVDGRPRSARVVAVDDCLAYVLQRIDFEYLLQTSHAFTIRLMQVLSVRLRASNNHFISELERYLQHTLQEVRNLEQLIEAAKIVNSTLDLDKLLTTILDTALKIVDGERGTLYLVDEERQELWSKILKGTELVTIRFPMGKGIAGYVGATGDTLNIPDAYLDPRFNPEFDRKTGYRTRTILCMPMRNKDGKIIGVLQLLNKRKGVFAREDETFIGALSTHAAIAIENSRLYEEEKAFHRMREEVRLAAQIQLDLLPKQMPQIPGYDVAGKSKPAHLVGGDYFDFIPVDDHHWALALGDVSGKGLPASLLMANVQATLRGQSYSTTSACECVTRSNQLLYRSTSDEKFVTLFYGLLNTKSHRLTYTNAGHDYPIIFSRNKKPQRLQSGGIVLGIMESFPFEEESVVMEPGDILVIYSDGVCEAMNDARELFDEDRLIAAVKKCKDRSAAGIVEGVISAAEKHAGSHPQFDDMTLIVVKRTDEYV